MNFDWDRLREVFDRTDGRCHICGKQVAFKNHGQPGERGAWEVEHSNPRSKGGSDRLNNLYAACVACNRAKRDGSTRTARAQHGRTRAPLSTQARASRRKRNAVVLGAVGLLVGRMALGPLGMLVSTALGAWIGNSLDVEDDD